MIVRLEPGWGDDPPIIVNKSPFLIGRADDCDHCVHGVMVSRHHCQIHSDGEQVWIRDLGSLNGTILNGERIAVHTLLTEGDRLLIGFVPYDVHIRQPQCSASVVGYSWPLGLV